MELYDIVIIGGSVAGLASAIKTKFKTLVIEKRNEIGIPIICGEYVPNLFVNYANIPKDAIAQSVKGMTTYLNDEPTFKRLPGVILNRNIWEKNLYEHAKFREVKFLLNSTVISINDNTIQISQDSNKTEIKAKIIIGADGPLSIVGRSINSRNRKLLYGYQYRVPLKKELDITEIHISKEFKYGYGWLFPKGKIANIGIGCKDVKKPWDILNYFVGMLVNEGKIENIILDKIMGVIPVGGILNSISSKNIMLARDAGGFTNPITGAGIYQAYHTGQLAGKYANEFLASNINATSEYESEAKDFWAYYVNRDTEKREYLEKNWDNDFVKTIKKSWIAYDKYYE